MRPLYGNIGLQTATSTVHQDLGTLLRQKHSKVLSDLASIPAGPGADAFLGVEDGWYTLLDVLCTDLQHETEAKGAPQVRATQVKEKFGRLSFRVNQASERQHAMICLAESLSQRTCEICGSTADELAPLLHTPRCTPHSSSAAHEGRPSLLSWLSTWASHLVPRKAMLPAPCASIDTSERLNDAIRSGDANAVRTALEAGAPLRTCTLDDEGYHTPHELAARHGHRAIERLIEAAANRDRFR